MIQQERGSGSAIRSIVLRPNHALPPPYFRRIMSKPLSLDAAAHMDPKMHWPQPYREQPSSPWRQIQ